MPPAEAASLSPELRSWLRRLQEMAGDLARRVADQEARLDHLTRLVEAAGDPPPAAPGHQLAHPPAAPGPGNRWRRLAGRLLRAPGVVLQRLRSAAQSRWILPVADAAAPPPLLWDEVTAIELRGRWADLPAGFRELALLVLASENLLFLELRGATESGGEDRELWLCRREWPWRTAADLGRKLGSLPAGGPLLGRRIVVDGDPHAGKAPAALDGLEVRGEYWLRPGAPAGIAHHVRLGRSAAAAPAGAGKVAIVATRPLDGGLEVLAAALLRAAAADGREAVLAAAFDLRASHRGLAEVAPRGVPLYPLATFGPPEVRGALLAHLLEKEEVGTLVQIGPGEGVFDQPALQDLLRRTKVIDLPLPQLPGNPIALGRPPGLPVTTLALEAGGDGALLPLPHCPTGDPHPPAPLSLGRERGENPRLEGVTPPPAPGSALATVESPKGGSAGVSPAPDPPGSAGVSPPPGLAARTAARERLGVPADAFVACQMADLVPGERPEDLVELAMRCPQIFFLQVGRGGLAGRRDDLARFRGVANLRCLPAADLGEVLAAADVLLALGEPSLWPWPIFAALAQGVPVAGRAAGPLARCAAAIDGGPSLAEIAAALERQRAGAPAPRLLPPGGPELATVLGELLAP